MASHNWLLNDYSVTSGLCIAENTAVNNYCHYYDHQYIHLFADCKNEKCYLLSKINTENLSKKESNSVQYSSPVNGYTQFWLVDDPHLFIAVIDPYFLF